MGCDIHMFCEQRKTINGDKKWVSADHFTLNHYFDPNDKDEGEMYQVVGLCDGRNYSMFTALCGVRDYSGESPKIDEPRGLPEDVLSSTKAEHRRWGCDAHSASYVTLAEVKAFVEANEPIKFSGLISVKQAEVLDNSGALPITWCQGSSDNTLVRRQWEDNTIQPLQSLYEAMLNRANPYLTAEQFTQEQLEDFRIIFWFDN